MLLAVQRFSHTQSNLSYERQVSLSQSQDELIIVGTSAQSCPGTRPQGLHSTDVRTWNSHLLHRHHLPHHVPLSRVLHLTCSHLQLAPLHILDPSMTRKLCQHAQLQSPLYLAEASDHAEQILGTFMMTISFPPWCHPNLAPLHILAPSMTKKLCQHAQLQSPLNLSKRPRRAPSRYRDGIDDGDDSISISQPVPNRDSLLQAGIRLRGPKIRGPKLAFSQPDATLVGRKRGRLPSTDPTAQLT